MSETARHPAHASEFDINRDKNARSTSRKSCSRRIRSILGLGVYIWNVTETTEVLAAIKRIRPEVIVILGGPEVSFEPDQQDRPPRRHVITGEADLKFAEVCAQLLSGSIPPKIIPAQPAGIFPPRPALLPLRRQGHRPSRHLRRGLPRLSVHVRVLSVVARCAGSRGEPYIFLGAMQKLLDRGVPVQVRGSHVQPESQHQPRDSRIFSRAPSAGNFYHFEMIPDRLPRPCAKPSPSSRPAPCSSRSASRPSIPPSANSSVANRMTPSSMTT